MAGPDDSKKLRRWHVFVTVTMFAVSIAIGIVAITSPVSQFPLPVYTFYGATPNFQFNITTTWLLLAATLINGIWHLYYLARNESWDKYYHSLRVSHDGFNHHLARHVNQVRWSLYGIFISLIVLAIAQHATVTSIFALIAIVGFNVLIQRSAFVLEMANRYTTKTKRARLSSICFGLFAWSIVWGTIAAHHFGNPNIASTPVWIYIAVIGTAIVTALFGITALFRYMSSGKFWKRDLTIEKIYLFLEVLLVLTSVAPILIGGLAV